MTSFFAMSLWASSSDQVPSGRPAVMSPANSALNGCELLHVSTLPIERDVLVGRLGVREPDPSAVNVLAEVAHEVKTDPQRRHVAAKKTHPASDLPWRVVVELSIDKGCIGSPSHIG